MRRGVTGNYTSDALPNAKDFIKFISGTPNIKKFRHGILGCVLFGNFDKSKAAAICQKPKFYLFWAEVIQHIK
jgi:hypothetical protein